MYAFKRIVSLYRQCSSLSSCDLMSNASCRRQVCTCRDRVGRWGELELPNFVLLFFPWEAAGRFKTISRHQSTYPKSLCQRRYSVLQTWKYTTRRLPMVWPRYLETTDLLPGCGSTQQRGGSYNLARFLSRNQKISPCLFSSPQLARLCWTSCQMFPIWKRLFLADRYKFYR